jgi:hypothetical protein
MPYELRRVGSWRLLAPPDRFGPAQPIEDRDLRCRRADDERQGELTAIILCLGGIQVIVARDRVKQSKQHR